MLAVGTESSGYFIGHVFDAAGHWRAAHCIAQCAVAVAQQTVTGNDSKGANTMTAPFGIDVLPTIDVERMDEPMPPLILDETPVLESVFADLAPSADDIAGDGVLHGIWDSWAHDAIGHVNATLLPGLAMTAGNLARAEFNAIRLRALRVIIDMSRDWDDLRRGLTH